MKKLVLILSLGSALVLSQSAFADGRYFSRGFHGGFNNWGYNHSFRSGFNRGFHRAGFNRPFHRGDFFRPYGYRGNVVNINYGNFGPGWGYGWGPYRYRNWGAGDIVGGIVLGSLITNSLNNSYRDYRGYDRVERVVYRSPSTVSTGPRKVYTSERREPPPTSGRRLLRDLEGRCYEIARNDAGDEVRTELDPTVCDY